MDSMIKIERSVIQSQRGVALVVSLIMLTAVTYLAVVSLQRSSLQVRMVGNSQLKQTSFIAAQSELSTIFGDIRDSDNGTQILNDAMQSFDVVSQSVVFSQGQDGSSGISGVGISNTVQEEAELAYKELAADVSSRDYSAMGMETQDIKTSVLYTGSSFPENTFARDSTVGTFVTYLYRVDSTVAATSQITSSQSLGIEYLAPAP